MEEVARLIKFDLNSVLAVGISILSKTIKHFWVHREYPDPSTLKFAQALIIERWRSRRPKQGWSVQVLALWESPSFPRPRLNLLHHLLHHCTPGPLTPPPPPALPVGSLKICNHTQTDFSSHNLSKCRLSMKYNSYCK